VTKATHDAVSGTALLRRYRREWLRPDLIAGLTVGAMLVPQSMAYAELAGVPPQVGLYAVVLAPVAYALVGTSRHLGTGPEPGTAILAGTGVGAIVAYADDPSRYLLLMAALALLVATIAGLARLLRLGFVASLLSKPVLVGYISGVGLVLISSQLESLTGVEITADGFFPRIGEFLTGLATADPLTVVVATVTFVAILALRRYAPRLPGALLAVGGATLVAWAAGLDTLTRVGAIPEGLPAPRIAAPPAADLAALVPAALGITLVGYSDNVLTARAIAARMGYRIDADRELTGLASANAAAGLLQGMPVSSSASRTAVAASVGGVTPLVGIVASAAVVATLLVAREALAAVPRAALAALILAAAVSIIDVPGYRDLWRTARVEFVLAVVTALGVMVFDVLVGVLVAVVLSVAVALGRMARPESTILGGARDLDGWVSVDEHPQARTLPGLLVYRFDAPLFFINAEHFRQRLVYLLDLNPGDEEWVVLDFEGIGDVDATAIDAIRELLDELRRRDVGVVAVARANGHTLLALRRAGLTEPTGPIRTFPTINRAVHAFETRA
jgi:sulfate permease, SulP family